MLGVKVPPTSLRIAEYYHIMIQKTNGHHQVKHARPSDIVKISNCFGPKDAQAQKKTNMAIITRGLNIFLV